MRLGHSRLGEVTIATWPPETPASATLVLQGRPMCLSSQPTAQPEYQRTQSHQEVATHRVT